MAVGFVSIGGIKYKLVDNGDGTVALAVSDVSGSGSSDYGIVRKTITFTGGAGADITAGVVTYTAACRAISSGTTLEAA